MSTFALLDTCSQGTFVPDNLLKRLGLSGVRTSINIKTLMAIEGDIMIDKRICGFKTAIA